MAFERVLWGGFVRQGRRGIEMILDWCVENGSWALFWERGVFGGGNVPAHRVQSR